ncbi:MAG: hypothetical protein P3W97_003570 [Tepidimonas sp.]|uniref:globin domain-containing protein n=1 Tax=Tepidimonas sp. TaxID=2002775 RepID=UPI00259D39BD|nr:hypothetical protein [Tepidimonas sp.]MDM7456345.1 hypothetical protein [Tepidimonas sp.]
MTNVQALTPYDALGGAEGLHRLVDRYYTLMDEAFRAWLLDTFAQMADHMINADLAQAGCTHACANGAAAVEKGRVSA